MQLKKWILGISLCCILANVNAQFGGGAHLGVNFTQVDGDAFGGYNKIGYSLGGFVFYKLAESWAFQPEILFSLRGSRKIDDGISHNLTMTYVDVPLMFSYEFNWEAFNLRVQAGPGIGYLLNSKLGFGNARGDNTNQFYRLDIAAMFGVEIDASDKIAILFRGAKSIVNIRRDRAIYTTNRYVVLGLRFRWGS